MKTIEVDDELYQYIASQTRHIGESASDILRRMLKISAASQPATPVTKDVVSQPSVVAQAKPAVTPAKDKVRAMRELLLSDEYAEQKKAVNRFIHWITKRLLKRPSRCTAVLASTSRATSRRCCKMAIKPNPNMFLAPHTG